MKKLLILITALLIAPALPANDSPEALQEAFLAAFRAGDVEGVAANYAEDAVSYDVGVQVVHGPDGVRSTWGKFFEAFDILMVELYDNVVETHGDTAIAWGEFVMKVQPKAGGEPVKMKGRFSDVSRNIDGKWLYVMDHVSMPPPPAEEE